MAETQAIRTAKSKSRAFMELVGWLKFNNELKTQKSFGKSSFDIHANGLFVKRVAIDVWKKELDEKGNSYEYKKDAYEWKYFISKP